MRVDVRADVDRFRPPSPRLANDEPHQKMISVGLDSKPGRRTGRRGSEVMGMQPQPLRGRSEPMERALSVVRAARRHGSGGVVLVSGPAGIGKSALLTEVCSQAERIQVRPALGTCDPIEQVSPGAPVITALRAAANRWSPKSSTPGSSMPSTSHCYWSNASPPPWSTLRARAPS